jgi:hypothetical protein
MKRTAESTGYLLVTALLLAGLTACNKTQNQSSDQAAGNPADGNLAPVSQPDAQTEPVSTTAPGSSYNQSAQDQNYYAPPSDAGDYYGTMQASEPPPPLPDYSQPPCPGDDYIWNPGYWGYADTGYYWVPGVWVMAPWVDALWTPPWWGFDNGLYIWHAGYWGPHIGFYGGIDYGFGYTGHGYYGAYWNNGTVVYNRTVTNVDPAVVHNTYNYSVPNGRGNRASYNGGRGGINARPTPQEMAVSRDPRTTAVPAQVQHAREASGNRAQFVAGGHAKPAALTATRPLATGYRTPQAHPPAAAMRTAQRPAPQNRAQAQPGERSAPPADRPQSSQRASAPEQVQHEETRSAPESRPATPATQRGPAVARVTPQARPQFQHTPAPRPAAPAFRPQAEREAQSHPAPQARPPEPERAAAPHPAPQARPAPVHTAPPQARPEAPRQAAPARAPEEKRK